MSYLNRDAETQRTHAYKYRGREGGYRYRERTLETHSQYAMDARNEEDMGSVTRINSHGVELGNNNQDSLDRHGFGGFGGFEGSIIGKNIETDLNSDISTISREEEVLQESAYELITQALKEASVHNANDKTVYLPLKQPDITYNFPAQLDDERNTLHTFYPTLHLRTGKGEKLPIRIGFLSGPYRNGVNVRRHIFRDHTQQVKTKGTFEPLPPYGLNVARNSDELDELPTTMDKPDIEFTKRTWGIRRITERVYRSPEGIQAFLESNGLNGKAVLAPLLFTLLRSGLPISDRIVRQAESIGALSLGVIRSNVLFIPYKGKVFSAITDKTTLLDTKDVAKIEEFLKVASQNNVFQDSGRAVEFIVRDIDKERFFVTVGDRRIGVTWQG